MRRGTTEIKSVTISGSIDFDNVTKAVMTIGQGNVRIHSDIDIDSSGNGVCVFKPEQTLQLRIGTCREQIKFLMQDGTVVATNIVGDSVDGDILNEEEL